VQFSSSFKIIGTYLLFFTEENKEGGDDANMTQVNGDILGNGATSQEDAEMEEGKTIRPIGNL
jgi:hypothetical protein